MSKLYGSIVRNALLTTAAAAMLLLTVGAHLPNNLLQLCYYISLLLPFISWGAHGCQPLYRSKREAASEIYSAENRSPNGASIKCNKSLLSLIMVKCTSVDWLSAKSKGKDNGSLFFCERIQILPGDVEMSFKVCGNLFFCERIQILPGDVESFETIRTAIHASLELISYFTMSFSDFKNIYELIATSLDCLGILEVAYPLTDHSCVYLCSLSIISPSTILKKLMMSNKSTFSEESIIGTCEVSKNIAGSNFSLKDERYSDDFVFDVSIRTIKTTVLDSLDIVMNVGYSCSSFTSRFNDYFFHSYHTKESVFSFLENYLTFANWTTVVLMILATSFVRNGAFASSLYKSIFFCSKGERLLQFVCYTILIWAGHQLPCAVAYPEEKIHNQYTKKDSVTNNPRKTLAPKTSGRHMLSSIVLDCNFDSNICGYTNANFSKAWLRGTGLTDTADTGPNEDHTSGSGAYVYIESSAPNSPNAGPFILQASAAKVTSVSFAYHMYGSTMGTMGLNTSTDGGATWVEEWSKSGDKGNVWHSATVFPYTASSTVVRFWGVTVGSTSDMALDDVVVDLTPAPTPAPTQAYASGQLVSTQHMLEQGVATGGIIEIGETVYTTSVTPAPMFVPSRTPSPHPTFAPTSAPTFVPSPTPSPHPTFAPTSAPMFVPSPTPSTHPTLAPTPAPTVVCQPGQYFTLESNLCTSCDVGRFANVSKPPWPSTCTLCEAGTYASQTASTYCKACPEGKLSSVERIGCVTCLAGQYTLNKATCEDCESGSYAPQALIGACLPCGAGSHTKELKAATTCTPCDAGSFSSAKSANCTLCAVGRCSGSGLSTCESCSAGKAAEEVGSSGCSTCQAGQFSSADASTCDLCAEGKSSAAGSQACESCRAGFAAPQAGSARCVACAAGSYSSSEASVNCISCSPGKAQGATGQSVCIACNPGKYSEAYGEASCSSCSGNRYSFEEAALCTYCLKEYFYFEGSCLLCPEGTTCGEDGTSTLYDLQIQPGWWRISDETVEVHQCAHRSLSCQGGLNFSEGYCADGHQGILCAVCSDGYYFDPEESTCLLCDDLPSPGQLWLSSPPLISFSVLSFIFIASIISASCTSDMVEMKKRRQRSMHMEKFLVKNSGLVKIFRGLLSHAKGGKVKLKALVSFFQIAQNIGFNCNVSFPVSFQATLGPLSVLNFNIMTSLGLECRIENFDYVDTLVAITLGPLLFVSLLTILCFGLELVFWKYENMKLDSVLKKNKNYALPKDFLNTFSNREIRVFRQSFSYFDGDLSGSADVSRFLLFQGKSRLLFSIYLKIIQNAHLEGRQAEVLEFVQAAEAKANARQRDSIFFFFLLFSYAILTGASSTIFEYFQCTTFEEVEPAVSYLDRDYSLSCSSRRYKMYVAYAVAMLFVYPLGIPLAYFVLLKRRQEVISCSTAMKREADMGNPTIGPILFLVEAYQPEYWWFEVVECFRRLLLASVIGIASEDSALAPVLGFLLCLAFLHLFSKRPFKDNEDSTLGIVLTYSLAFIFLGALLIKVDAHPKGDLEHSIFEITLVFLLTMGPGIIIIDPFWSFLSRRFAYYNKQAELPFANRKSVHVRRPRHQLPLVKPRDSASETQLLRSTNADNNSRNVQDGRFKLASEGHQPDRIIEITPNEKSFALKG